MLKALSPLPSTYTPTFGTSGVSGYITAPSLPKPLAVLGGAASILGSALLINDVIGKAGGYQWRDDLLAKIGGGNISRSIPSTNPGSGQQTGVTFYLVFNRSGGDRPSQTILIAQNNTRTAGASVQEALAQHQINGSVGFTAPVSGVLSDTITSPQALTPNRVFTVGTGNGTVTVSLPDNSGFSATGASYQKFNYSFGGAIRIDGQPETGAPDQKLPPIPFGYTPTNSPFKNDQDRKVGTPPPLQASRANGLLGALGLGGAVPTQALSPSPVKPANPNPNPNPSVSPPFAPSPNKPPLPNPAPEKGKEEKKAPPNPSDNKPTDINQKLGELGAIMALIKANTEFDKLKDASKTGTCDALQSPSCTKGVEDRIKNPIEKKQDTLNQKLFGNSILQDGVLALVVTRLDQAKTFSEKVARAAQLDKVYNFLTFITVIHNAQMLSASLSTTLMDALSLGLATFNIKDENESPIDIQSIINKSVEDTVKGIIGASNYATLTERWQKAMTVYRAGTNMLYQVRSLWDSAKSLNEMTGANVGQLMNALRRDGVVSENAYPNKSESPQMVNGFMTKLENLDNAASALQGITSETSSMVDTVAQLRKDREDFEKLVKESPKKAGVENDAAKLQSETEKAASVSPTIERVDLSKPDI